MVRRRTGGVVMDWKEAIKDLPVILKAHIYEPKIEDVAKASYEAGKAEGRKEVVEFRNQNPTWNMAWEDKLKEWGL